MLDTLDDDCQKINSLEEYSVKETFLQNPLGRRSDSKSTYDNNLLYPIKRTILRSKIDAELLPDNLVNRSNDLYIQEIYGFDIWNCYEVSWLDENGKPTRCMMQFIVPITSEYIVESKSLKLYLNSLNNTKFVSNSNVIDTINRDITSLLKTQINVNIFALDKIEKIILKPFDGINIDDTIIAINDYNVNADLLKLKNNLGQTDLENDNLTEGGIETETFVVEETLTSNLLRTNCPVTNQPDWASVQIQYKGRAIEHSSLLQYIISFRNHNGFHEQCVESIYYDIMEKCAPESLIVHAKFTRRGGIDINPVRSNHQLSTGQFYNTRDISQ